MNDETTNTAAQSGERVGFCQDCGKPLTQETVRAVGSGVFCDPCLATRVGAGAPPTSSAPFNSIPFPQSIPQAQGAPSPKLAGFLGIIPGVGAMYNGQYAKGLAHFAIFAVLVSLGDSHSLFGLMATAWWIYQIFDAYHTAKARLEGLPLPNPFGLNDIGDRMGFGKGWPGSATRPVTQAAAPPATPPTAAAAAAATTAATAATPSWVGYVPPTQFAQSPAVAGPIATPYADPATQPTPNWGSAPYTAPAGTTYTSAYTPYAAGGVPSAAKRFPTGAIWLIGLGLLFTLANFDHHFELSGRWITPVIFAGLAIWTFVRRIDYLGDDISAARLAPIVRAPAMLMVLAVLFILQACHAFTLGQTWPVILLAFGALLIFERSVGAPAPIYPQTTYPQATYPPATYAATAAAEPTNEDASKGGQA